MGDLWLPLLGFAVGIIGTLVGAGGGFALAPVLLFAYPGEPPEVLTSITLAVALFNAISGSIAYARQRRIDYRTGLLFAAATIPGSVAGVYLVRFLPRGAFNLLFGLLLLVVAALLVRRPVTTPRERVVTRGQARRRLIDRWGQEYQWSFSPLQGTLISLAIGFISSTLGIGGGIIHVPVMTLLLGFPVHIATATSQFILTFTAGAGTLTHLAAGDFATAWQRTLLLSIGVIAGAQLGGAVARRSRPALITRSLAVVLVIIGLRLAGGPLWDGLRSLIG